MFQLSPEGRKSVKCICCIFDFPYDVVFFSSGLGVGAFGTCSCVVVLFVCLHPTDFIMFSLHSSSAFHLHAAVYAEAKGNMNKIVLGMAHSG